MNKLCVSILAGGHGKRMNGIVPKILQEVNSKPMIINIIDQVLFLSPAKIIIVTNQNKSLIKSTVHKYYPNIRIKYAIQLNALGTGHAMMSALNYIDNNMNVLILNGDVPLITYNTLKSIYESYLALESKLLVTTIRKSNPFGNGRIILDNNKNIISIVEEKDCTYEQKLINLINCGIYITNYDVLTKYLPKITNCNKQREYYLTDIVKIYLDNESIKITLHELSPSNENEIYNVNTMEDLSYVNRIYSQININN